MAGRRRALAAIAAAATCVAVAGCAASGSALRPVTDRSERVEIPGVSVLPPPGPTWFLFPVPPADGAPAGATIRFVKQLRDTPPARPEDDRLVYAAVFTVDLGRTFPTPAAFVAHFEKEFEGGPGAMITGRQRLVAFDAALDESLRATCVRYRRVTEMTGLPRFPAATYMLATRGFYCAHPRWPQYAVNVFASQMYLNGSDPLPIDGEIAAFLASPVFNAARPVAIRGGR